MSDVSADVLAEGGGLYQRILLRCRFFLLPGALGSYCRVNSYPLSLRAFW